jgi:hypothetical protein
MKQLLLSDREAIALDKALELYIRLGLGQLTEVTGALKELHGKRDKDPDNYAEIDYYLGHAQTSLRGFDDEEWKLEDAETDSLTIAAFGIQAKLGDNTSAWEWACKRLHDNGDLD